MPTNVRLTRGRGGNRHPRNEAKAPVDIPEVIRAYAAGFVDGEGSIGIRKLDPKNIPRRASPDYGIIIQVANTHEGTLRFLCEYFGGQVYRWENHTEQQNGWRPRFAWILHERQAHFLLELLLPYLRVKREHAEICIDFYKTRRHRPSQTKLPPEEIARSEGYYLAMRLLNKRGAQHEHES